MPIPDHLRKTDQPIYEFKWKGEIPTRSKLGLKHPAESSRIIGCMVMVRESDHDKPLMLVDLSTGLIEMDLVGYAIVPIEEWNQMVGMAEKYSENETHRLLSKIIGSKTVFTRFKKYIKQILHIGK